MTGKLFPRLYEYRSMKDVVSSIKTEMQTIFKLKNVKSTKLCLTYGNAGSQYLSKRK